MKFLFVLLTFIAASALAEQKTSFCETTGIVISHITCPSSSLDIKGHHLTRTVKYSLPPGKVPKKGWPTVVIFQGSFFSVDFERYQGMPFGGFNEIRLIQSLLDHGFAVIAPPAISGLAWMTNLIGIPYENSEDEIFIQNLLQNMNEGSFGPINMSKLFATGISSGGYNTSRMALSFPGVFKALAIQSGSWATCGGPLCNLPEQLPEDHPPTLFLHGDADLIVPISTMLPYYNLLKESGVKSALVTDPTASHQWLDQAPDAITKWFVKFRR
ncbi:extracellular medium-chain-length polyhydroxyalkanoate depolymerase [Bdellovibrio svalbardensis]|uniref:Dipeptidyl aminopeptidase n=1 Tax=Bdellovibrio svalbardensis TaxID=2972972 RepID=A0ABT6DF11_9BACT|nr:dipeptidyl aminopeptidase [Bdellovibrio svalbardensis]MDG0815094.1 dipeptidyl aminopeptidase [Bdellovibrio svalbardensis]